MALRGVECVPCRAAGHRCPAVANDGEAKCLDCMNEQPCAAVRCAGQVREESSVLARVGLFGEIEPTGVNTEVRQRTPEELGLAREIPYVPVQPTWIKPTTDTGPGSAARAAARWNDKQRAKSVVRRERKQRSAEWHSEQNALALAYEKSREITSRVIGSEPVLMPVGATMGAELIGGFIEEQGEVEVMPTGYVVDDATKAYIAADAATMTVNELCAKYKLCEPAIRRALKKHGVQARPGSRGRSRLLPRKSSGAQLVHVDPKANGSAHALLSALERVGTNAASTFSLTLSLDEAVWIVSQLSADKQVRFVEAGLRAAVLE